MGLFTTEAVLCNVGPPGGAPRRHGRWKGGVRLSVGVASVEITDFPVSSWAL